MSHKTVIDFEDLRPSMRVFDISDGVFGDIINVVDEDPEWRMIEVRWDREDPSIHDVSYVLPGTPIGIVIAADDELMEVIRESVGDQLDAAIDEHGDEDVTVLALAHWE